MIELKAVFKTYPHSSNATPALRDVNMSVTSGEIFGVIGHSGAGKSTLVRCISLLEPVTSGSIVVDGQNLSALRGKALRQARMQIGIVFQHFNLLNTATVFDNVALPLRLNGTAESMVTAQVELLLERVGLMDHADKVPAQLSGGQKQRVGIARALVRGPRLLLCDEATSALDPEATQSIVDLLVELQKDTKLTMLVVTHEMDVVRRLCQRLAVMSAGKIVETGSVADVFLKPRHGVTRRFSLAGEALTVPEMLRRQYNDMSLDERLNRQVLALRMQGHQAMEPVLDRIMRDEKVELNIVRGAVSSVKMVPFAHLLVELRGDREARQRTVARLRDTFDVEAMAV